MRDSTSESQREARRLVAEGRRPAQAVVATGALHLGAATQVDGLTQLEAARYGMSPELLRLVNLKDVTDVVLNGKDVWIDRGVGLELVDPVVEDPEETRFLAIKMAAAAGKRLDDATPIVDAMLSPTIRCHAILPPLASRGASISLRLIRNQPFDLEELVECGSLHPLVKGQLVDMVKQRKSILFSGSTGSGKTTLMASALGLVSPNERIVCIEEVSELAIQHPHVVQLQSRGANVEGEGAIEQQELVRAAVRMRPDRLVLGECRGSEVREVLTAMNTGHQGSMATIHANSIEDVPARLRALGMLAGMDSATVAELAASAFDSIVHLRRSDDGLRYVSAIGTMQRTSTGLVGRSGLEVSATGDLKRAGA